MVKGGKMHNARSDPMVEEARKRIGGDVRRTPLERSAPLGRMLGCDVYIKWESEQVTGSFKARGALNRVRTLTAGERNKGVVSASTGNHGAGLAHACGLEGVELTLCLPLSARRRKVERLRTAGAAIVMHGSSCEQAELHARAMAGREGRVYVSPYNDRDVIRGQATVGLEILEQLPGAEDIIVPVGGGGLIAGIAGFVKSAAESRGTRVWGVEPQNSRFMAASVEAGKIVRIDEKETLADAVAGGIEPGSITFDLCRRHVDGFVHVEERDIASAMALLFDEHGKMVEGAGALALAALMKEKDKQRFRGRKVVLVVSGGNIPPEAFRESTA
ncbi:MAG: pyridoxal-phosphate dependent enzyme [Pseudomonadota bacterium]